VSAADFEPNPSDEEAAAILAAYEVLWPKPVVVDTTKGAPARWRFSGRWWTKPIPIGIQRAR